MDKSIKNRSINFTEGEKQVLVTEFARYGEIINGEFSASLTAKHKENAWKKIADAVNAVAPTYRQLGSIKTKWKDMKRETRQKLAHNKTEMLKTGGGKANLEELNNLDEIVETQLGKSSVHGMGQMDLLAESTPHPHPRYEVYKKRLCPATVTRPSDILCDDNVNVDVTNQASTSTQGRVRHSERAVIVGGGVQSEDSDLDNPIADPPTAADEPKKKRRRVRRSSDEVKAVVIKNQENQNKIMENIRREVCRMNDLQEAKIKQDAEHLEVQKRIANTLDLMLTKFETNS